MIGNQPVLLFMIPFLAALITAVAGWFIRGVARWVTLLGLAATAAVALIALPRVVSHGVIRSHAGGWPPPIGIELLLDPLSALVAAMVAVVALVVLWGAGTQIQTELSRRSTVFYASSLLLVSGLMGMVVTGDLFNLFVFLEVASLSAYALVAAGGRGAPRAALNYLIIGSFAASLYLMGVGFLYAATGTLNMADVAMRISAAEPALVLTGGALLVAGLGTKMALFPLHVWMPAAYARAPVAAAALMAPLVTKVAAYALIRVLYWVVAGAGMDVTHLLLEVVAWTGALAMVGGGLLALLQKNLRRLLAYSSIGQMGVIALGIGLANASGLTGAVVHLVSDALAKGLLFMVAGMALIRFGVREVQDLRRLRDRAPWTRAAVVVAGLSLIGVPPLSGFFGKWYVLTGAMAAERWVLAAALILGSLASVGYVFRIFEPLFFGPRTEIEPPPSEGSPAVVAAIVILAVGIILFGAANERVVTLILAPVLPGALP